MKFKHILDRKNILQPSTMESLYLKQMMQGSTYDLLYFLDNFDCRLHPNRLIYLFLAVFAFFRPFCYAKTAFSCSRALLSPCTPDLFMVKDVVKSEYRMIDMWSPFIYAKLPKIIPICGQVQRRR